MAFLLGLTIFETCFGSTSSHPSRSNDYTGKIPFAAVFYLDAFGIVYGDMVSAPLQF